MGIYSSATSASSYLNGKIAERDLFAECGETATFEEISLAMVAESEQNYNSIMKAIALDELAYFEENGVEIVYEASGISGIFDKIKAFFKKLIEKIRQVLHTFFAKMNSWVQSDKEFVQKYEKEFATKWSAVKGDFGFKGYKFTVSTATKGDTANYGFDDTVKEAISNKNTKAYEAASAIFTSGSIDVGKIDAVVNDKTANAGLDGLKKTVQQIRDDREDIQEKIRAKVFSDWVKVTSSLIITSTEPKTAEDFSKDLFESYRNGDSTKDTIEKKDLSVSEITGILRNQDKTRKAAEDAAKILVKKCDNTIKVLEKAEKVLVNYTSKDVRTSSSGKTSKENRSNVASELLTFMSMMHENMSFTSQLYTQANGIYLQALSDQSRQCKAIMVKVIGGSKKMTESYDYGSDSDYSGSYLESVKLI